MEDNLYQEQILDRYHHPHHLGEIKDATFKLEGANRSCGDELQIYIQTDDQLITDARFTAHACAVCTASADLTLDRIIGQPTTTIDSLTADNVKESIGIPLSPIRLKCALLPLETLRGYKPNDNT